MDMGDMLPPPEFIPFIPPMVEGIGLPIPFIVPIEFIVFIPDILDMPIEDMPMDPMEAPMLPMDPIPWVE
jgi:hypothetical protein